MTESIPSATNPTPIATRADDAIRDFLRQLTLRSASLLPTLTTMSRLRRYSLSNQLLIFLQCPHATDVRGYRAWQRTGYQVRKGEKGIAIYAPAQRAARRATPADSTAEEQAAHDGDDNDTRRPTVRFRIAYVWDLTAVDRLDGTPAAVSSALIAPDVDPDTTGHAQHLLTTLTSALTTQFILTVVESPLRATLYGHTDGQTLTRNATHDVVTRFGTLVHEATHARLHFGAPLSERGSDTTPDLTTRETEAEAVAYIVCTALDLPSTTSIDYIRSYRGTPERLRESLTRIRATANEFLEALLPRDSAVSEIQEPEG